MNKFDFDSMLKHGFLIIPKSLLLQMTTDRQMEDEEIVALLTILIKVNFSETEHIGYQSRLYTMQARRKHTQFPQLEPALQLVVEAHLLLHPPAGGSRRAGNHSQQQPHPPYPRVPIRQMGG